MVRINKGFCMAASRSLSAKTAASCDPPEVSRAAQVKDNPGRKYEYLDHPADIQIHSWGANLAEAYEQAAIAMFGYMTELDMVQEATSIAIEIEGHDLESLLFNFLDEFLFNFSADPFFVAKKVKITEFDDQSFKIKAEGFGETFDLGKHPQGTEVKAITYSNMQVHDTKEKHEVYVIVDI